MLSNPQAIITIDNLTKEFLLPSSRHDKIKSQIINFLRPLPSEKFKALDNIHLAVNPGEFISIIGQNGSGKTTLFKLIAGILKPTSGEISIKGKVLSMLELGIGFQPELTGQENVYLSGSLMGVSKEKLDANIHTIFKYAEIENFRNLKLKNYSSGMRSRLAFSILRHAEGDIILCDEVLAVGDESFQKKCLEEFRNWHKQGKTILFITHNLDYAVQLSNRVVYLKHGKIAYNGKPSQAVSAYLK